MASTHNNNNPTKNENGSVYGWGGHVIVTMLGSTDINDINCMGQTLRVYKNHGVLVTHSYALYVKHTALYITV